MHAWVDENDVPAASSHDRFPLAVPEASRYRRDTVQILVVAAAEPPVVSAQLRLSATFLWPCGRVLADDVEFQGTLWVLFLTSMDW